MSLVMEAANLGIDFANATRTLVGTPGAARCYYLFSEMKSAYELAMERLNKDQPSITLTDEQKKELAEIDSLFQAKLAEKEVFLKDEIRKAQTAGKFEEVEALQKQLNSEVQRLKEECEAKKEKRRASFLK